MVPWLGVCVPIVVDTSSIPGQGAKISHVTEKKKKKIGGCVPFTV